MVSVPGASHAHFMQYAQKRLLEMARTGEPYEGPPVPRLGVRRTPTIPPLAGPRAMADAAPCVDAARPEVTPPVRAESAPDSPRQRSLF